MNTVYLVIPHTFASPISHSWTPNVGLTLKEEHARSKHAAEKIPERHREHESNRKGRGSLRGKLPHLGFPKGRHQFPVNNTSVWQHLEAEHPGSSLALPSPPTPPLPLLISLTFPFLLLPSLFLLFLPFLLLYLYFYLYLWLYLHLYHLPYLLFLPQQSSTALARRILTRG